MYPLLINLVRSNSMPMPWLCTFRKSELERGKTTQSMVHVISMLSIPCTVYIQHTTVKPPNRGHLGTGHLSLVERLSSSQRFCFKPIRNSLKTNITLEVFFKCIIIYILVHILLQFDGFFNNKIIRATLLA